MFAYMYLQLQQCFKLYIPPLVACHIVVHYCHVLCYWFGETNFLLLLFKHEFHVHAGVVIKQIIVVVAVNENYREWQTITFFRRLSFRSRLSTVDGSSDL